jgi:hypothetical protein
MLPVQPLLHGKTGPCTGTDLDGAPPSRDQLNLAIFSVRHLFEMIGREG